MTETAEIPAEAEVDQTGESFIKIEDYSFWYGEKQALNGVNLDICEKEVTAFIGPSGCGKSTLLRSINRMNDLVEGARHEGDIRIRERSIFDRTIEVIGLRKRVGMVFQKSNPFPKSIYENVVYPLRVAGKNDSKLLDETVERSLRASALWDEVKDGLKKSALELSGGQTQRLCIARAIANQPEILLMDEPCASLDPVATEKVEELITELKKDFTIVIVTHNLQQAQRCSDVTAFMYLGKMIEVGRTRDLFEKPDKDQTSQYIAGQFG